MLFSAWGKIINIFMRLHHRSDSLGAEVTIRAESDDAFTDATRAGMSLDALREA